MQQDAPARDERAVEADCIPVQADPNVPLLPSFPLTLVRINVKHYWSYVA